MSASATASASISKPDFEMIFEICTPSVYDASIVAPDLPVEQWEAAWNDLQELHRAAEVGDCKAFHGRRYLIHSNTVKDYTVDYIIERVATGCGWNPCIVIYHAEKEESPYPYTEEWFPPQTVHELDVEELISMPGLCYNCQVPSLRICYECGVGICDKCAPHSGMCPICVMEHNEY